MIVKQSNFEQFTPTPQDMCTFLLKNPGSFNDDVRACFFNIWVFVMCLLAKTAYHLAIPDQMMVFYFCIGIDPKWIITVFQGKL